MWQLCKKLGGCIIITICDKSLLQITTAKLLQITTKSYYKLRQLIYYTLRQFCCKLRQLLQIAASLLQTTTAITNCDKNLLQITTAKLLQITTKFYYKLRQLIYYKLRQFYYELRQLLQIVTNLLQITTTITNCDNYYKLPRNSKYHVIKIYYVTSYNQLTANEKIKFAELIKKNVILLI